jgi:hypothetical protein
MALDPLTRRLAVTVLDDCPSSFLSKLHSSRALEAWGGVELVTSHIVREIIERGCDSIERELRR